MSIIDNNRPTELSVREHWPWYAAAAFGLFMLWLLVPILTPFVVGAALAYVGDPVVDRLQTWRLSRTAGVCVVFVVLALAGLLLLLLIVPLLLHQLAALVANIPDWLRWLQDTALPRLGITLPEGTQLDAEGLRNLAASHWSSAGGFAQAVWTKASESGAALITAVATLLLVPVVTFYLLRDWDVLVAWVRDMIPPRHLPLVTSLARETDEVLGSFIRGQLSVMAALALLYGIGLTLAGVKLGLVIGVGAGLISFVPYLGFVVGLVTASIAVLVQTHEWLPLVWVLVVFGIGQVLESSVLTPTLVGDKIGLHPVAVIFAVMAGGQLFGFIGVLLALPVAAVVAVVLRHTKTRWLMSPLYLHAMHRDVQVRRAQDAQEPPLPEGPPPPIDPPSAES
jgi:predicted PurR-regulated permease PerM